MEIVGATIAGAKALDYTFQQLTKSMNGTLGAMLLQYRTLLTTDQCDKKEISYNNSKWRIIVRCGERITFDDATTLLAMLVSEVEAFLEVKSIHFEQTSITSMLTDDRRLIKVVQLEKNSMELWECSRSSPNFTKKCVDSEYTFHKTEWSEWKKVIGL